VPYTRLLRVAVAVAVGLVLVAGRPALAQSLHSKVDRSLQDSLRSGAATQHVIITIDDPAMRDAIRQSLRAHGDVIESEHPLIGAFAAEIHSGDVELLARHPGVHAVSANARVSAGGESHKSRRSNNSVNSDSSDKSNNSDKSDKSSRNWDKSDDSDYWRHWNDSPNSNASAARVGSESQGITLRQTLGLPRVATSTTPTGSTGIGVAIIDSGIAPSANFNGRITGFFDFTRGGIPTPPFDDYGHGTHIAGLIGSSGVRSDYDFQGIAPDVHLVGLKVLDKKGQGNTSDVIKAIEYVTANRYHLNVQIINLSLGHPIFAPAQDDPLVQAVEAASRAGLIVVASAGNYGQNPKTGVVGYAGLTSPGNSPSAITVGAVITHDTVTRKDDVVAPFSSRGPSWYDAYAKPDVVAPGYRLASDVTVGSYLYNLLPKSRSKSRNGQRLLELSGTSMSAGVTSGVVALMLDAHNRAGYDHQKALGVNAVKAMLEFSALPLPGADYLTQGAGEINAAGAIALASAIDTSASNGDWWLRAGLPTFSVIGSKSYAWSQNIIWGDRVLTGELLYHKLKTWSQNIIWGDNIVWSGDINRGSYIVWADLARIVASNIVWNNNIVWRSNIVWGDRMIGLSDGDNIIWGSAGDNIVWGSLDLDNIVWGSLDLDNIVWGSEDNIVWSSHDNLVWGSALVRRLGGIF
jgi:serine protease AprX